ncbi:MAG: hypothetical protein Q8Q14_10470 [Gemmatimonadales bacterium]|nr:hypothetical protein [Gemmatimonadales bacterium]
MAPFIAGNRVIVGPSGGEFGIHGWVKALAPSWEGDSWKRGGAPV